MPKGGPRIVPRIEQYFEKNNVAGGTFSHFRPASYFLREQAAFLPKVDSATLERVGKLFAEINETLK